MSHTSSDKSILAWSPELRERSHVAGFTMVELMVVVMIVAVLALIALPNYLNSVTKSNRRAAAGCTIEAAQFMERFYTTNLRYDQSRAGAAPVLPQVTCSNSPLYSFALRDLTTTTYTIAATPQGAQASRDTSCGELSINQAGIKSKTGTATVAECW